MTTAPVLNAAQQVQLDYQANPQAWETVLAHQRVFEYFLKICHQFAQKYPFLRLEVDAYKVGQFRPIFGKSETRARIGWMLGDTLLLHADLCEALLWPYLSHIVIEYEYVPGTRFPHRFRADEYEGVGSWSPIALLRLCEQLAPLHVLQFGRGERTISASKTLESLRSTPPPFACWTNEHLHPTEDFAQSHLLSNAVLAFGHGRIGTIDTVCLEVAARYALCSAGYGLLSRPVAKEDEWFHELTAATPSGFKRVLAPTRVQAAVQTVQELQVSGRQLHQYPSTATLPLEERLLVLVERQFPLLSLPEQFAQTLKVSVEVIERTLTELRHAGQVTVHEGSYRVAHATDAIRDLLQVSDQAWTPADIIAHFPKLKLSESDVIVSLFTLAMEEQGLQFQVQGQGTGQTTALARLTPEPDTVMNHPEWPTEHQHVLQDTAEPQLLTGAAFKRLLKEKQDAGKRLVVIKRHTIGQEPKYVPFKPKSIQVRSADVMLTDDEGKRAYINFPTKKNGGRFLQTEYGFVSEIMDGEQVSLRSTFAFV